MRTPSAASRFARARVLVCFAVVVLVAVVLGAGCGTLRAKALLEDAVGPPGALRDAVSEHVEHVASRAGPVSVRITRPKDADGPLPAFVLCHGAAAGGADDARMVAFGRAIAARGATVAAPDLAALRGFRLDPADPARLADVGAWLAAQAEWTEDGRVAYVGISVGGSYALLACAQPELAERVSAVLAFGAYDDLDALLFEWMTEPASHPDLFDPLTEGRRLVLLGNVDTLVPADERDAVALSVQALLDGTQPPAGPPSPSPRAAAVLDAARSEAPLSPTAARSLLAPLAETTHALSPSSAPLPSGLDVYLLHATSDPVVPAESVTTLAPRLEEHDCDVDVHVTDVFEHVDANRSPGFFEAFSLLRFFADFLDDAGL